MNNTFKLAAAAVLAFGLAACEEVETEEPVEETEGSVPVDADEPKEEVN